METFDLTRPPSSMSSGSSPRKGPYGTQIARGDVWPIATTNLKDAHFAVFPEKLVTPCILAGTSAKGCCPECGAPWTRIVEKSRKATRPARNNKQDETGMANRDSGRHVTETITTGWRPGCTCTMLGRTTPKRAMEVPLVPAPCLCLDPFAGSGTVGVVCKREGRNFIGLELNPSYCEMAKQRIAAAGDPK